MYVIHKAKLELPNVRYRPDTVLDGEDIQHFLHIIVYYIKLQGTQKSCPSLSTILTGLHNLHNRLITEHANYHVTLFHARRCESLLNSFVKKGILFRGLQRPRIAIGFQILQELCNRQMITALTYRCSRWDTRLSRQLSVILVASIATIARSVARSDRYTSLECLCQKHITLQFKHKESGSYSIDDAFIVIQIAFERGRKQATGSYSAMSYILTYSR